MIDLTGIRQRAHDLILFADGWETIGAVDAARRARAVAHETLHLATALEAEQSARVAMQAERDRLRSILTPGT